MFGFQLDPITMQLAALEHSEKLMYDVATLVPSYLIFILAGMEDNRKFLDDFFSVAIDPILLKLACN